MCTALRSSGWMGTPSGSVGGGGLRAATTRAAISATAACAVAVAIGLGPGAASAAAAPRSLFKPQVRAAYAFVNFPAVVRVAPRPGARPVGTLGMQTADGTDNLVQVLAAGLGPRGGPWLRVRWSVLPNDISGWVPAWALGPIQTTREWLLINTKRRRATLLRAGRVAFKARIGVGAPSTATPHGQFYVIDRLTGFPPDGLYGPLAFGTSARSPVLTDWPGGGVIGIHGTDQPQLIPGRPSHGCIRMRNRDIRRLGRLLAVGTPVTIF